MGMLSWIKVKIGNFQLDRKEITLEI